MNSSHLTPLSPRGLARRDQILALAQDALALRRRRRVAMRVAAAVTAPIAGVVLSLLLLGVLRASESRVRPTPEIANGAPSTRPEIAPTPLPSPAAPARTLAQFIRSDPALLDRVRVVTRPIPAEAYIDDFQLQELLTETGRDAGLIRLGHRVILAADLAAEAAGENEPHQKPD